MSEHQHVSKVVSWGMDEKFNTIPTLYGCTLCEATSESLLPTEDVFSDHVQHTDYVDGCFGCKIRTLELSTGDANGARAMSQAKWDKELNAYADARSQGIQPAGTTMKAVQEAKSASDKLGVAYNAESMPAATKITKQTANVMRETKAI